MLSVGEALELLLLYFPAKPPLLGQCTVPFATYAVALGVIVLLSVGEFLLVICLGLARAERFGDCQHNSFTRSMVPGRQRSPSGFLPIHSDWFLGWPERQLVQMTSFRFRSPAVRLP